MILKSNDRSIIAHVCTHLPSTMYSNWAVVFQNW